MDSTWVSATATRNFVQDDPLLDWLDLYGKASGFQRDDELPGFDPETDMGLFLRDQGRRFEAAVMDCIRDQFQIVQVAERSGDASREDLYHQTLNLIAQGVEIIYQAVLWDSERKMYGSPDLLVRSDVIDRLVAKSPLTDADRQSPTHYRVVDIKFTGLDLTARGMLGNDASDRQKKAQLLVYNRALAAAQGYEPPTAYLIGRSWKQTVKGEKMRGDNCLDRLAPADMNDPELADLVDGAASWIRRVRDDGAKWQVLPQPSVPELYPHAGNTKDSPWRSAKKKIADELGEVTMLWQVSPRHRPAAHAAGILTFRDENCDAAVFEIAEGRAAKLAKILEVNRSNQYTVLPERITAEEAIWREPKKLEFYVDFETVNDLNDDFSTIPARGGQPLIFMIGCGHIENGEWQFRVFTCDRLTEQCEADIIQQWHTHMHEVRQRHGQADDPLLFHWSHAETSTLYSSYNSALERQKANWPDLNWFDFLSKVMRQEPVVVKGALAFGLKHIARAMKANGHIETEWEDGPGDGLAAMVGAWSCDRKAAETGGSMRDFPLMTAIEKYNEVDCRVMQEIIAYLRTHH
jgi:predicted RecB family nuclease